MADLAAAMGEDSGGGGLGAKPRPLQIEKKHFAGR